MREYLDSVIKAHQCAQYVDDIGISANTTEQLIKKIRAVFKRIEEAGLKLTIEKCHFGVTQVEFFGKNHHIRQSSPTRPKCQKFSLQSPFPEIKKGSVKFYQLCKLLPKLHTTPVGKTHWFVRISKNQLQNQYFRRVCQQFQRDQR